jgi:hypothetical protein
LEGTAGNGEARMASTVAFSRKTVEESSATSRSRWAARSSSALIRLRAFRPTIADRKGVKRRLFSKSPTMRVARNAQSAHR